VLRNIVPMMLDEGIPSATVEVFLRANPRALLAG
jgi:hypothetical protein